MVTAFHSCQCCCLEVLPLSTSHPSNAYHRTTEKKPILHPVPLQLKLIYVTFLPERHLINPKTITFLRRPSHTHTDPSGHGGHLTLSETHPRLVLFLGSNAIIFVKLPVTRRVD
ncbi:hypothetical protein DL93DRAFT_1865967 [Clavulina sp. PMI_390]|nr:hypothetical protein DL93DRAFT_1865967 [Clavulina sp. PMI_390]